MHPIPRLLSVLILTTCPTVAVADELATSSFDASRAGLSRTETEQIHEQLRALKATMENALNSRDLDALLENVDENVVFTTMNGDVVVGRSDVADYFHRMLDGPDAVVERVRTKFVPDALSILHGVDAAISWGHTNDHYVLRNGTQFDISARWSAAMVHRDGRWLVASFHYSTDMFDNPVLTAQRRVLISGAIVAMLLALALGFVLGRQRRRVARA